MNSRSNVYNTFQIVSVPQELISYVEAGDVITDYDLPNPHISLYFKYSLLTAERGVPGLKHGIYNISPFCRILVVRGVIYTGDLSKVKCTSVGELLALIRKDKIKTDTTQFTTYTLELIDIL